MAKQTSSTKAGQRMYRPGALALEAAQASQAGTEFEWHFGRETRLGHFAIAGGRAVGAIHLPLRPQTGGTRRVPAIS